MRPIIPSHIMALWSGLRRPRRSSLTTSGDSMETHDDSGQAETTSRPTGTGMLLRKVLLALAVIVLIPVVAIGTLLATSGFSDGPSAVFGGGPLVEGELVTGPEPDWSFVRDLQTVELQLVEPPRSRLVFILESEGKIYVVSGYMGSWIGRLWKRWPAQAERDGRAVLRVDGKRYERTLRRIMGGPEVAGVEAELARKYGAPNLSESMVAEDTWLFELAPRDVAAGPSS